MRKRRMARGLAASIVALAVMGLATPTQAQTQTAMERYRACHDASAADDERIVEICVLVDDIYRRLAAHNSAHQRRVAHLNNALAQALLVIGERGDSLALEDSIVVARQAAQYFDSIGARVRWAGLQLQVAGALNLLSRDNVERAREAVEVSRAALAAAPRGEQPDLWAALHMARAHALMRISQDGDRASLVDAFAAIQSALEIYRAPRFADERARAEADLAWVQRGLGQASET